MLALVHPVQPDSVSSAHRQPSSSSSSSRPQQQQQQQQRSLPRKSSSSSSSSTSRSSSSVSVSTSTSSWTASRPAATPVHHDQFPSAPAPAPAISAISTTQSSTLDIHSYPSNELLRLLASLLAQIASTNDQLSPTSSPSNSHHSSQSIPPPLSAAQQSLPIWSTLTTASRTSLSNPSSQLTFHARNIPTISLEAYLLRILKYCPTTNEVFLSLLVYFDRMSKLAEEATGRTFVIDSFNVHRLVIAGVTVASKFFSDVFYTNSRYAKVGGLPQPELNQLELQFLLLNDFRLVISSEEMQRYAEQLIVFSESSSSSTLHLQSHPPAAPLQHPPAPLAQRVPSTLGVTQSNGITAGPTQAMGAIDAYGGTPLPSTVSPAESSTVTPFIASTTSHVPTDKDKDHKTPSVRPQILGSYGSASSSAPLPLPRNTSSSSSASSSSYSTPLTHPPESTPEYESDADTDLGAESGTEGGWTDDEPTIRPAQSVAGVSETESDCASLRSVSVGTEDGDEEHEEGGVDIPIEGEGAEREMEAKGERTPEQGGKYAGVSEQESEGDFAMASP